MKFRITQIKAPYIIFILIILGLQIFSPAFTFCQNFNITSTQKKVVINFEMIKNLIIIPLYINGKGPYNFILDTGVGPLIITEPSLIDTLNLKNLRSTKVYGLGQGEEIEAFLSNNINVDIKDASIEKIPTAILKKDIFNLSSYLGSKIYGIVGFYFFNSFVVKINYSSKKLSYQMPTTPFKKKGLRFPLEINKDRPYLMVDIKTSNGQEINAKMIIDCGAGHALSMEALNDEAFPLPDKTITANLGVGLSGLIDGHIGRIPLLSIGKYKFKNVVSGFPAFEAVAAQIGYKTKNGNIGAELLRRFDTIYDYQNEAIYLKPNRFYNEPFEHDMSGLEIYTDPVDPNRFIIGRIEAGSPAEKAGLKPYDEILSMDLKHMDQFTLEEVTKLLRSINGKTILIEVARNNKSIIKLLQLKRRI